MRISCETRSGSCCISLPFLYIGQILAVAIHEILGHGLAAVALGGTFDGFGMRWDGMGWAYASLPPEASQTDRIVHLAAGVIATISSGLVFLALAHAFRRRIAVRFALLIGAVSCLLEGLPYIFWNAYHPVLPGDIGRILALWCDGQSPQGSMAQIILLSVSGPLLLASTFVLCALLFQAIEQALVGGGRLRPIARFWTLLLFLAIPGAAAWFTFDWNQLAPGIGILPCVAGAMSVVLSAIVLFRFSLPPAPDLPRFTPSGFHVGVSWGLLLIVLIPTSLWFHNGVRWN